jgi:hypothetical protein
MVAPVNLTLDVLMKYLVGAFAVIACFVVGVKCLRSLRLMLASGCAYPVFDWRELYRPRQTALRSEAPALFFLYVFLCAGFAVISLAISIGVSALGILTLVAGSQ